MTVRLHIEFSGSAPGIEEHRLDLVAFGNVLIKLAWGLRRTASSIAKEAVDEEVRSKGRVAKAAELRVELATVTAGSLALDFVVGSAAPGVWASAPWFDDLPARAADRFFEAVERESRGSATNTLARKFLKAMPPGVTSQKYVLSDGSRELRSFSIGEVRLAEIPPELPGFVQGNNAQIQGVSFSPRLELRLGTDEGVHVCSADERQVEEALKLRGHPVSFMAVSSHTGSRLLWLRADGQRPEIPGEADRTADMFSRWDRTLRRLAE